MDKDVRELAQRMKDGSFTILDFIKQVYPAPAPDHELYAFFKTWGYNAWLEKEYDTTLHDEIMVSEGNYNYVKSLAVVSIGKDNKVIPSSIQGLPLIKTNQLLYQYPSKFVAKDTIGVRLWTNDTTEYSFCMFPDANGSSWIGNLRRWKDYEYINEDYIDDKQVQELSTTKHFAINTDMVGVAVKFMDNKHAGKVGKVMSVSASPHHGYTSTNITVTWQGEETPEVLKDINMNFVARVR